MKVLGIETSCDDTSVAIYDEDQGVIANEIYSQIKMHDEYGGVVPELASRDHIQKLLPLLKQTFAKINCGLNDLDAVAYTQGPGLAGALMVGAAFGKALAYAAGLKSIGVHHMEAHLLAALLETPSPKFPFLGLLVSGGHTLLVNVEKFGHYTLLGESIDDAAGEAFDKTAKLLGLPYPGGPAIANLALQGDNKRFIFPRPMTDRPGLDFSFSGLKTAALNAYGKYQHETNIKANIAVAFQEAVVETLFIKCRRALQQTGLQRIVVAGGVSANSVLREKFKHLNATTYYPRLAFCTDNGAMVAFAGYLRLKNGFFDSDLSINTRARWSLETI